MIKKTEGIILRVTPYSESDAVCLIYTKSYGKKSFFVKGGLSKRTKKRVYLKEGLWVEIVFYEKSSRQLQKLTDIHLVQHFMDISTHPIKLCLWLNMIEVFRDVIYEEELPDEDLYNFLIQSKASLENCTSNWEEVWIHFHMDLLAQIGYGGNMVSDYSNNEYGLSKNFVSKAYRVYEEYAKHIEGFRIPKSFEVLKQMLGV